MTDHPTPPPLSEGDRIARLSRAELRHAAKKLNARTLRTSGCWLWIGSVDWLGYGQIHLRTGVVRTNRLALVCHTKRQIPTGLYACHRCDNPRCVRPSHLFVGSNSDNKKDSVSKRRHYNTRKTHCSRGHAYAGANLLVVHRHSGPYRRCRECERARWRAKYHKQRALDAALKEVMP